MPRMLLCSVVALLLCGCGPAPKVGAKPYSGSYQVLARDQHLMSLLGGGKLYDINASFARPTTVVVAIPDAQWKVHLPRGEHTVTCGFSPVDGEALSDASRVRLMIVSVSSVAGTSSLMKVENPFKGTNMSRARVGSSGSPWSDIEMGSQISLFEARRGGVGADGTLEMTSEMVFPARFSVTFRAPEPDELVGVVIGYAGPETPTPPRPGSRR